MSNVPTNITIASLNNRINSLNQQLNQVINRENLLKIKLSQIQSNETSLKKNIEIQQDQLNKAKRDLTNFIIKAKEDLNNERLRASEEAKKKETEYKKTLYKDVYSQNQALLAQQTSMRDSYSTDDQKVYYQAVEIQYLAYYNYILMIIYYILAAICVIILFFRQETIKNIYVKGVLAVLILSYLYTIPYIESLVYNLLAMSSSLIYGDVYLMKY